MFMAIPLIAKPSVYYAGAVDTPLAIDEYFLFQPKCCYSSITNLSSMHKVLGRPILLYLRSVPLCTKRRPLD